MRYAPMTFDQAAAYRSGIPLSPSTGFTAPTATYEKMRAMEYGSAAPLLADARMYLAPDNPYRKALETWYERAWSPFFEKYAGPNASEFAKLGAAFTSDNVARQAETYRLNLNDFYDTYPKQTMTNGQPVPRLSGVPPELGGLPEGGGLGLPWWMWALGIAAVGGIGYLGYVKAKELRAKRAALEEHVLPKLIGKDLAKAAAAR